MRSSSRGGESGLRGLTLDVARERRILALYETIADLPPPARESELAVEDPVTADAVRALLARDERTTMLHTISSEPPEPEDTLPERVGPYRIVAVLGRGGMGTVLLGERDDGLFEHQVAIKLLRAGLFSPRAREQFAAERGILARLHHPHIAQLFGGGVDPDGRSYIVMEVLAGEPITDHADARQLGLAARLSLFLQACEAAEHAHRALIVHSDIKPSNVVVTEDFGVKLLDFGIARVLNGNDGAAAIGHTPGFASAAQRAGLAPTPADDVHALGRLLAMLLAGFPLDRDLSAVVAAASAPMPSYGSISELIADLGRWRENRPVRVRRPEPAQRARLYWRRHRAGVTIIAGTILLLAASTAVALTLYVRAARAQAAAEARFDQTRSLSRYLIDDVAKALAPLPGSDRLRRAIAERANRTFAELGRVPGASEALQIDGAEAYTQIGAILSGASLPDGDPAAADRALRRADDDLTTLHRANPARADVALALARALIERARSFARNFNDDTRASAALDRADTVLRGLRGGSGTLAYRLAVWDAALMRAEVRDDRGEFVANAVELRRLIAHASGWKVPDDADRALRVERGSTFLANSLWYPGDKKQALAAYREGLRALADPRFDADARILQRRAYAAFNIASALDDVGTTPQALAAIRPAVDTVERLRMFDSSISARNIENIVRLQYAFELSASGRHDQAVTEAQRSVAGRRGLAALQPGSYFAVRSVPVGMRPLAEITVKAGRQAEACAVYRATDRAWNAIAKRLPLTPFDATTERGEVTKGLAQCAAAAR